MQFKLVRIDQKDLIHNWLKQDHIKQWLHGQGLSNTLEDLEKFFEGDSIFQHWIAYDNKTPFAYLLTSNDGSDAITLDLFIGNLNYLGKGLAAPMIKEFLVSQFANKKEVFIDPEASNIRAIRAYEKVGFKIIGEFIAPWHPVPHYKMSYQTQEINS